MGKKLGFAGNVFDPVMGHYFNIVKSKKIYNHQSTIVIDKLRFSSLVVLHLLIVYMKKYFQN